MSEDRFDQINIGDEAEIYHVISTEDVDTFVKLTGDNNPLHVDDDYAATTLFRKRVVHGMLTASFISTIVGTRLPGKGALWYEQKIRFLAPVRIGERIRVWAKVRHKSSAQRILILEIVIFGDEERRMIEGEAKVKVLKPEIEKRVKTMSDEKKGAIIVTGASRGIGAAIAKELANTGHPIIVNYISSNVQAENVVEEIKDNNGQAIVCQADVSNEHDVGKMVELTKTKFENIAGVVNNASATVEPIDFTKLSWDIFQKHIDIQLKGTFHLSQAVLPYFLERQDGIIINIASIYADNAPPVKLTPYNIVKSALISFSRCLAAEFGSMGIRVNCVSPGMTHTDMIADLPEKVKIVNKMQTPLRRLALPEDVAGAVSFLFSDKASFITGQNIRVCGGIVMV